MSFSVVFPGGVLEHLLGHFSRNGCHLGAFGKTFSDILEVCGVLLDATHSQAKTNIFRFWRTPVGTYALTFPGLDSGCVFDRFFCDFL